MRVEVAKKGISGQTARSVRDLWATHGVVSGDAATVRLGEVLAVLLDDAGIVVGTCSVTPARVAMVGDRLFHLFRHFVIDDVGDEGHALLFNAAFDHLEADHVPGGDGPIGLCHIVQDARVVARRREAVWEDTLLRYVGYLPDGQLRVRYFTGAHVVDDPLPDRIELPDLPWREVFPLSEDYRIEVFEESQITSGDVLDLWAESDAVVDDEAARRVHEVTLVAVHAPDGALAGVTSASLVHEPQLRMHLWEIRAFVAPPHRRSNVAMHLTIGSADRLEERFVSGQDTRAVGLFLDVQNEGVRRMFPQAVGAVGPPFTFVRSNERGDTAYTHFFPGALAPLPP